MRRELCWIAGDYPDDYRAVFRIPSTLTRPLASRVHTGIRGGLLAAGPMPLTGIGRSLYSHVS